MNKITSSHLERQAYVYVRQSTPGQVMTRLESKRRQYALVDRAKALGWQEVRVIDDDQGRTGSGALRPGFERLLADVCVGNVGAIFAIEASRLSRNDRDWCALFEFCKIRDVLIIDDVNVYDLGLSGDRLVLGMLAQVAEIELSNFRQRAYEAEMQKARRGELFMMVAVGYVRVGKDRIEMDPDRRIREAINLVFRKFRELGSVRQVLLWLRQEHIELPAQARSQEGSSVVWRLPAYNTIHHFLTNPIYGGAYVFGRTKTVTTIENGRKKLTAGHSVPREEWPIFIPDHHEGYISWEEYEANRRQITHNAAMKGLLVKGPARDGEALLAGLLRCGHCGRKLHVGYSRKVCLRYSCKGANVNHGGGKCISFGGLKADRLVEEQLLQRLSGLGVRAALQAIEQSTRQDDERIAQKELALQQAKYEVTRARRQYDAVDPDNRLVAAELERRWNDAIKAHGELEQDLQALRAERPASLSADTRDALLKLGDDLPALWSHPMSPPQLKKRIVRTVLREIVVNMQEERVRMVLHWIGGDHSELEFLKNKPGVHRYASPDDIVQLVRELARVQPDASIASILNRLGRRTGKGHTWTEGRVCAFRGTHGIAVYREGERLGRGELTLEEAAKLLQTSTESVRRLIVQKVLVARQACTGAPWVIQRAEVDRMVAAAENEGPHTADGNQIPFKFQ
jgi:DNA invertase Pin-like site-specific DNA recombinase